MASKSVSIKENKEGELVATKTTRRTVKKIVQPSDKISEAIGDISKALTMDEAIELLTMNLKGKRKENKKQKLMDNKDLVKKLLKHTDFYLDEEAHKASVEPTKEEETASALAVAKKRASEEVKPEEPLKIPKITLEELKKEIVFPSTVLVLGKKFSGKTNLIRNLVDKKKFDVIILFTVSKHTNNLNMLVKGFCPQEVKDAVGDEGEIMNKDNMTEAEQEDDDDDLCIFEEISDEIIDILLDYQRKNSKSKMLMLFDDFISGANTLKKAPKILLLATSGRNFGISIIIASQILTPVLPTAIRKNAEYLLVGKNMLKTSKQLGDEFGTVDLSPKELTQEIQEIRDHSWLFYDERKASWAKLPQDEIQVFV